jgi:hypothetical protein
MTHRKYEVDGYAIELVAMAQMAGVAIYRTGDLREGVTIPWKTMQQLCRMVSDWDIAARDIVTEYDPKTGKRKTRTEFS